MAMVLANQVKLFVIYNIRYSISVMYIAASSCTNCFVSSSYIPYSVKLWRWKSLTNFDEYMLNRQSFPYQNFALRKSQYCLFYGYNLLANLALSRCYVGTWNVEELSSNYP